MLFLGSWLARENSRHLATLSLVSPPNDILMTRHYPALGSASDWSCCVGNLIQPIRRTTLIWVVMRHQYGISALVSLRRHLAGKPLVASPIVGCFLRLVLGILRALKCSQHKNKHKKIQNASSQGKNLMHVSLNYGEIR